MRRPERVFFVFGWDDDALLCFVYAACERVENITIEMGLSLVARALLQKILFSAELGGFEEVATM